MSDSATMSKMAEHVAVMVNLKIKESMPDAARYGGMMKPRGGR